MIEKMYLFDIKVLMLAIKTLINIIRKISLTIIK